MRSGDFQIWPEDTDDEHITSHIGSIPRLSDRSLFTEMTFSMMVYRAGFCQRRITELGLAMNAGTVSPYEGGSSQLQALTSFERQIGLLSLTYHSPPTVIENFTSCVAEESFVTMRMFLYRPLYRSPNSSLAQRGLDPGFDILNSAKLSLDRSQMKRAAFEFTKFAWFPWIKWYALAVVLVELCQARGPTADRAWVVAQSCYNDYATHVADSRDGQLWRPITKLLRRVKKIRDHRESLLTDISGSLDQQPMSPTACSLHQPMEQSGMFLEPQPFFAESVLYTNPAGQAVDKYICGDTSTIEWDSLVESLNESDVFDGYFTAGL
jgi:hypothetical protein